MENKTAGRGSLTTGYLWTFGSTALPLVSAFFVSLIVARWMGPRAMGLVNWAMALATIFLIPAKFGIDGAASRLVTEYQVSSPRRIRQLINSSLMLRLAFTVPVGVAVTVLAPQLADFFREKELTALFRICGLVIFSVSLNELAALLILGLNRFGFLFAVRSATFVLRIALTVVAARFAMGASGVLGAYVASMLAGTIMVYWVLWRMELPAADPGETPMIRKRLLRLSAPLAISGASVTIYSIVDKLMLGYFNGADEVGLYSIARNLHETTLFPTFALVMMLRPALAEAWSRGDMKRFTDLVNRSILDCLHFSLLVVVVFACLASPIITGLFTDKFESSTGIMLLFLPIIVLRGIGSVVLPGLVAADRADTYARLTLAGAVLNFALNMLMIPVWGAKGAVISTLISYLPIEVFGLRSLYRMAPGFWGRRDWIKAAKSSLSATTTVLLYMLIAPGSGNIVQTILHAAVVSCFFSGLLLLSRAITVKELMELARPLIKRR